jgi:hypothetical protein
MFEPHPSLNIPKDDARVWRYMDIGKLVSLLNTATLFFCRLDRLRDPYEGLPNTLTLGEWKGREASPGQMGRVYAENRLWMYVNSWHLNEFESAAMWELYLKTFEGIAVETTCGRLRDSFCAEKSHKVFIGTVNYIDYETEPVPSENALFLALHKRRSFAHEQELRALIWLLTSLDTDIKVPPPEGVNVRVDLLRLIRKVFVSPSAGSWYVDVVAALLEKFGCGAIPVIQSHLYSLK